MSDRLQHVRPEERPFAERCLEWAETVAARRAPKLTPFLDPREKWIVRTLIGGRTSVSVSFFGGYDGAERERALIHPDFWWPEPGDFRVAALAVEADRRFVRLTHRDVLGALVSLGLKRDVFGDILLTASSCYVLVAEEIAPYVCQHLTRIHLARVRVEPIPLEALRVPEPETEEETHSVASMRLDALIAAVWRLSRGKAALRIRAGDVKVNWRIADDPDETLGEGDVVSVRGFGRFRVAEVGGPTRKGRLVVRVAKFR